MKKLALLLVAVMVFAGLFTGCTTTAAPTVAPTVAPTATPTTAATEAATPTPTAGKNFNGLTLPISTTNETITFMCGNAPYADLNKTPLPPILTAIEKATGLNLVFNCPADYGTTLTATIASGANLPDSFIMGGGDLVSMGKAGTIINLKDLLAKDCPNTMLLLQKYPLVKGAIVSPEGDIWGFPNRVAPADDLGQALNYGYRLDWVKKLESEGKLTMSADEPVTIDDWTKMLTAFRDGDPNGNGKADELPLAAIYWNQPYYFGLAYGMSPLSDWFSSKGGTVSYDWTDNPHARDYVTQMNQWFKDKLLDNDYTVDHEDAGWAGVVGNTTGACITWTGSLASFTTQMQAQYPGAEWIQCTAIKGPFGDQAIENYPYVNGERWMITKSAKNPDAILKLFDYLFATDEGQTLNNYGIEGQSYNIVDGKPSLIKDVVVQKNYDSDPGTYIASQGGTKLTDFIPSDWEVQTFQYSYSANMLKRLQDNQQYIKYMFPSAMASISETVALKKVNDIDTIVNSTVQSMIIGKTPITDATWATFQKALTDQGIADIVKIKQIMYDRYQAASK